MQLGILIENMRREGFELSVSPPKVLFKRDPESQNVVEPFEEVYVDCDDLHAGPVIEKLTLRKGDMKEYKVERLLPVSRGKMVSCLCVQWMSRAHSSGCFVSSDMLFLHSCCLQSFGDKTRLVFHIPSRGLLGFRSEFIMQTRGQGVMTSIFLKYAPYCGPMVRSSLSVLKWNLFGIRFSVSRRALCGRVPCPPSVVSGAVLEYLLLFIGCVIRECDCFLELTRFSLCVYVCNNLNQCRTPSAKGPSSAVPRG